MPDVVDELDATGDVVSLLVSSSGAVSEVEDTLVVATVVGESVPDSPVGSPSPTQVCASSALASAPNRRPDGQSLSGKLQ
jgi:hypothetical protein